jgi:hypothetical protein
MVFLSSSDSGKIIGGERIPFLCGDSWNRFFRERFILDLHLPASYNSLGEELFNLFMDLPQVDPLLVIPG